MSVPAQPAVLGVAVLVLLVLAAGAGVLAVRRSRRRQAALDALLERSRSEVESLSAKVEQLSAEVQAGRAAQQRREQELETVRERGYVITTLAGQAADAGAVTAPGRPLRRLEDRVLGGLAGDRSRLGSRAVDAVVEVMALGHGVRRALAPENLDRAAAEAHLARRRSRRTRRQEVRQARRVLRAVRTGADRDVA